MDNKKYNWDNISQYKIDKFTEAWSTMYILNIVSKYKQHFSPVDKQYIMGYIKQYYDYYQRVYNNDPELRKILRQECEKAVKEDLEEIYKAGVQ